MDVITLNRYVQERCYIAQQGIIGSLELRLFQNDLNPSVDDDLSSFVEATFSGYTRISSDPTMWTSPNELEPGVWTTARESAIFEFNPAAGSTTNTVYGFYGVDTGINDAMVCGRFENPIFVTDPTKIIIPINWIESYILTLPT